ncbi:glycosyltransferase [Marinobacter sp. DUT-1]|uniref:glycosyltransferase n=1 Tax=Marinobacter sp. DUT-1 TaxID=3412037 RepID=UPI003D17BBEB
MPIDYSELNIIFHHPRPITANGLTGSQVRPYKMLQAFKKLGVNVLEVTGEIRSRSASMDSARRMIEEGKRFDFVYTENLTIPFAMSEEHRLPTHPFLDHSFLAFCNSRNIPVSLFNRDVYWRDKAYKKMLPWWGRLVTIPLHWYDWWWHTRYLNTLYLPSEAMGRALPWMHSFKNVRFLPPGTEIPEKPRDPNINSPIRLFYVGGIKPPNYDLRPLLAAMSKTDAANLTVCCRESEWDHLKDIYIPLLSDRVSVVHRSGAELDQLYEQSDLFIVVRDQGTYLDYSVPIKLYESLGHALPVLCNPGGETARIVDSEKLGWIKDPNEIPDFLATLAKNSELIKQQKELLKKLRHNHTWTERAAKVCKDMTLRT